MGKEIVMACRRKILFMSLLALALSVGACGGGGVTTSGLASIPAPPPRSPSPPELPPAPPPTSFWAKALPGVSATTDFVTAGADAEIRWNAELNAYEIQVAGLPLGRANPVGPGTFGADLVAADGNTLARLVSIAVPEFQYTGWAELTPIGSNNTKHLAFGVETGPTSVPTVGTASYGGQLQGSAGGYSVYGEALFNFDFGAGSLSGYMAPLLNGPFGGPELPRYNFTQTVYSSGSRTFSGAFDVVGPTPSSLAGTFTGPAAQELMASFKAPFFDYDTWGTMEGVIIGRRR